MATSAKLDLLEAWAAWQPNGPPFLFDDDRDRLASPRSSRACVCFNSWHAAFTDPSFGQLNDRRLHVGLLPHPYCGDLRRASIYLLMLNPGLGPWGLLRRVRGYRLRGVAHRQPKTRLHRQQLPIPLSRPAVLVARRIHMVVREVCPNNQSTCRSLEHFDRRRPARARDAYRQHRTGSLPQPTVPRT